MKLYAITLETRTTKTITLAADSIAEATLAAKDIYHDLPHDIAVRDLSVVEATPLAEAT